MALFFDSVSRNNRKFWTDWMDKSLSPWGVCPWWPYVSWYTTYKTETSVSTYSWTLTLCQFDVFGGLSKCKFCCWNLEDRTNLPFYMISISAWAVLVYLSCKIFTSLLPPFNSFNLENKSGLDRYPRTLGWLCSSFYQSSWETKCYSLDIITVPFNRQREN